MDYILIWTIKEWPEMGGGTYFELFSDLNKMDDRVDVLLKENGKNLIIEIACSIKNVYKYAPTEVVKKLSRVD